MPPRAERSRPRHAAVFRWSPDAYLVTTPLGVVMEANPAAAQLLRVSTPDALRGRAVQDFIAADRDRAFTHPWEQEVQGDQQGRVWLLPAGDAPVAADVTCGVLRDHHGRVVELCWLMRAAASRSELELTPDASTSPFDYGSLTAGLVHDLRAPLSAISAMCEAFEDGLVVADHELRTHHEQMRGQAERLSRLTDDLVQLWLGVSSTATAPRLARLSEILDNAIAAEQPLATCRQVNLSMRSTSAVENTQHVVDPLRRVLGNLLNNGVRHGGASATVRLHARLLRGQTCVEVSDECGGIPQDDLPLVFEAGFRGGGDGGGLGLSVARSLTMALGGHLSVRNITGGCRFRLVLPSANPRCS